MANNHTSLATKWRPQKWEDVCGQHTVVSILKYQIETETFKQAYLLCGKYGSGKTTIARLLARSINGNSHDIIEIDAASNNGVEQVRAISDEAHKAPLVGKFKIFLVDECHLTSAAGWGAWLKLIEEPPQTAIFIFATTDPQKIPNTILSRVQRYDFTNIPKDQIVKRLKFISEQENIDIDDESIDYIAKSANGGMRDAISMLDKCNAVNDSIRIKQVTDTLSIVSYDVHLDLLKALIGKDSKTATQIISDAFYAGKDLKIFMNQFMSCVCDVCNYFVFNSFKYINIPNIPENTSRMANLNLDDCVLVLDWSKVLNAQIRPDNNPKNAILVEVMLWCKKKPQNS